MRLSLLTCLPALKGARYINPPPLESALSFSYCPLSHLKSLGLNDPSIPTLKGSGNIRLNLDQRYDILE